MHECLPGTLRYARLSQSACMGVQLIGVANEIAVFVTFVCLFKLSAVHILWWISHTYKLLRDLQIWQFKFGQQ